MTLAWGHQLGYESTFVYYSVHMYHPAGHLQSKRPHVMPKRSWPYKMSTDPISSQPVRLYTYNQGAEYYAKGHLYVVFIYLVWCAEASP